MHESSSLSPIYNVSHYVIEEEQPSLENPRTPVPGKHSHSNSVFFKVRNLSKGKSYLHFQNKGIDKREAFKKYKVVKVSCTN